MLKHLISWLKALDELFFPRPELCCFCLEKVAFIGPSCQTCLASFEINWLRQEIGGFPYFSLFPYQGYGREMIRRMKFQNSPELALYFGHLLSLAVKEEPELQKVDTMIPVPLSDKRILQRGFNQSALLADSIRRGWRRPLTEKVIRVKDTLPQSELSQRERKVNLQGAFRILPDLELEGMNCLIIDDIITSGATFLSLAELVESNGGRALGLFLAYTKDLEEIENAEKLSRM